RLLVSFCCLIIFVPPLLAIVVSVWEVTFQPGYFTFSSGFVFEVILFMIVLVMFLAQISLRNHYHQSALPEAVSRD
ncbi:MAG: hypothetical protein KC496_11530, partial [Anaerolineae bacterium]|nr:hypothetical protein [Anaerolineae bacterium]